jgi:hypothetical protein
VKKISLIFSFWPLFALGQVNTGFEGGLDAVWEQFPENCWESSPEQSLSGLFSLHHNFDNTVSRTDFISFETGNFDTNSSINWEFTIRHGYFPSSSNKWHVYLAVDKGATEFSGSGYLNGYVLGVNIAGSDDSLRIYSIQKGKLSTIGTSLINYELDIGIKPFHCSVFRDSVGMWEIFGAETGLELKKIGSFQEVLSDLPVLNHFMLSYSYTSAKDRLLWFDDLVIQANYLHDTIPPEIIDFEVAGPNELILELSEIIDAGSLSKNWFLLVPGNVNPENLVADGSRIYCYFKEEFLQKTDYKFVISDLVDIEGNVMSLDSFAFFYYRAEKDDIVVSEIMADPSPPVYLFESEYIELYSRSEFPLQLDSFVLQTGKKEWVFPECVINPGGFIIVTGGIQSDSIFLSLFTSSSVITNDGQQIFLKDKYGGIVTATDFSSDWYDDDFKSGGGWSLERIDIDNLCGGKENWRASVDPMGGTPGGVNSVKEVNPDLTAPFIERIELLSDTKIRLVFSEIIDPNTIPSPELLKLVSGSLSADSVLFTDFLCNYADITFKEKFENGMYYQMLVPEGITDCAGNLLETANEIRFGLPSPVSFTDIIITEVMFSNIEGCVEYIELYNQSENVLDLSDLRISVSIPGDIEKPSIPIKTPVLFFPGEYIVLCKDKQLLLSCYFVENESIIIETKDLPSLTDNGACIKFSNRSLETVDIFCYDPEDEFPMLLDFHGVSLERLTLDRKTGEQSFWHSASSLVGFGTPGAENSQTLSGIGSERTMEIIPEIFSPNNDGKDDILEVHFSLEKEGFVGTVAIFDPSGRLVNFLGENEIMGTSGMFLWDGRDDLGNICGSGLYLVYAELWNLKGEKERFKKAAVLVRQ